MLMNFDFFYGFQHSSSLNRSMTHCLNKNLSVLSKYSSLGNMLKTIIEFEIHQNLFQNWFSLLHFATEDPVGTF